MFEPDETGVYMRVTASAPRRWLAYFVLVALGLVVIYVALVQPPAALGLVFLLVFGVSALWLAERLRAGTRRVIELTDHELRDTTGVTLAKLDEIERVSRGLFSLKPPNGFSLVLKSPAARAWVPGLWWRLGRRVGVGGVTSAGQTRLMAEQIATLIKR